jgi:hypothetical protein
MSRSSSNLPAPTGGNFILEASVVSILEHTAADSKNYQTRYYNLDAIIAVGYQLSNCRLLNEVLPA